MKGDPKQGELFGEPTLGWEALPPDAKESAVILLARILEACLGGTGLATGGADGR